MNKQEAQQMRHDITVALEPVFAKHGMVLRTGTIRFDATGFKMPVEGVDLNADIPEWQLDSVGLPAGTKPGVQFVMQGVTYRFDGIAPNRPKYPINATNLGNGKQYKLTRHAADLIAKEVTR